MKRHHSMAICRICGDFTNDWIKHYPHRKQADVNKKGVIVGICCERTITGIEIQSYLEKEVTHETSKRKHL